MSLYEDAMNELIFDYDVDDERVTISAFKNKKLVGKLDLVFIFDAYHEFEDVIADGELDEQDIVKIFPNNTFAMIEHLSVVDGEMGKGYTKQLMNTSMDYARSKGETVMYLNASPMGFKGLRINDLVGFYKSFGFQSLIDSGHNVEMFMNI